MPAFLAAGSRVVWLALTVTALLAVVSPSAEAFLPSTSFLSTPTATPSSSSSTTFGVMRSSDSSVRESSRTTVPSSSPNDDDDQATLTLFSPCKINLFLRILRKRDDGYHDLASLFQAIGFGDTLELTPLDDSNNNNDGNTADIFTCNMPGVPVDASNLVLRALQLMRDRTGLSQFYRTNLIKQCPAQAGLGGGSANAATALWGSNELMGRPATLEQVRSSSNSLLLIDSTASIACRGIWIFGMICHTFGSWRDECMVASWHM